MCKTQETEITEFLILTELNPDPQYRLMDGLLNKRPNPNEDAQQFEGEIDEYFEEHA